MHRLAIVLFLVSGLLLGAGIANADSGFVAGSIVMAVVMLVTMFLTDRAEAKAAAATAVNIATAEVSETPVAATPTPAASAASTPTPADDLTPAEILGRVQGLGPRRVEAIAGSFGSAAELQSATKDDLIKIPGVGAAIADRILAELV